MFASGFLSSSFHIPNGSRQGCPLPLLIFYLCVEQLDAIIRESPSISGIKVVGIEHKCGLYAKNVMIICKSNLDSISALLAVLKQYSKVPYYKLKHAKSTIIPITHPHQLEIKLRRSDSSRSYLIIKTTPKPQGTIETNVLALLSTLNLKIP